MTEENFKIGIIGGAGKMGRLFQTLFERKGYEVFISDVGVGLSLEELMKLCKVILIAVPMEVFPKIVKEISPLVSKWHWIIDICSLKLEPSKLMVKHLKGPELLATHPLFGPFEDTLKNKSIAIYPLKGKNLYLWFKGVMEEEGLRIIEISPKRHDQIMGLVQVINHFWLLLLAKLIRDSEIQAKELVELSTPSFLSQLIALSRLSKQDENLYAKIQLANPYGKKFRNLFCKNCSLLNKILSRKNSSAELLFKDYFRLAKELAQEFEQLLSVEVKEKTNSC